MLIQLVFVQWGVSPPILYYTELCGSMFVLTSPRLNVTPTPVVLEHLDLSNVQ